MHLRHMSAVETGEQQAVVKLRWLTPYKSVRYKEINANAAHFVPILKGKFLVSHIDYND